jgi:hypothetical protein
MIKKITLITLLMCLSLGAFVPGAVLADGELAVISSSAEMDFPMRLIFSVTAESDVDITDIRLCYQVERMEHVEVFSEIYVPFVPSTSVTAQGVVDMRKTGGLPPGTSVAYWWRITDTSGKELRTTPARIDIEDNRYDWRQITEGDVTIFWYKGNDNFASELMEATQSALTRLADNTGAELENPVRFYVYASASDLRGAMIYPQEWTGGVAFTRYGTIAIGISPSSGNIEWGKRTISHELTHLVIHQVTFNPYSGLPVWLDEGLAMFAEGELTVAFSSALVEAWNEGCLLTVRSLASPFSAFADESLLAYTESYKLVEYLIDNYGRDKMQELLNTFKHGSGYDDALEKVYGFDMDGLNDLWRADIENSLFS